MMTAPRLAAVALAAAVFGGLLVGCSDGGDDEATTTTDAPATTDATTTSEALPDGTVAVDEWARGFCDDVSSWLDELTVISVATADTSSTPAEAQDALAQLFGQAAVYTTQLADRTAAGGVPDVDGGEDVTSALEDRFLVFAATASGAKEAVEALDVDDPAFADQADAIASGFRDQVAQVGDSFADIDATYGSEELGQAVIDACDF
jgi:hypothetical protein